MSPKRIDWEEIKRTLAQGEKNLVAATVFDEDRRRTILQKRAEYFAARSSAPAGPAKTSAAMAFILRKEKYAVETAFLRRVMAVEGLVPVPGAPQHLLGVMNMGGEVGSVWDLAGLLEIQRHDADPGGHILVLKADFTVGLRVDYIEGSLEIDAPSLIPPQDIEGVLPIKHLKGMTRDRILILDAEAILAEEFLGRTARDQGGQ